MIEHEVSPYYDYAKSLSMSAAYAAVTHLVCACTSICSQPKAAIMPALQHTTAKQLAATAHDASSAAHWLLTLPVEYEALAKLSRIRLQHDWTQGTHRQHRHRQQDYGVQLGQGCCRTQQTCSRLRHHGAQIYHLWLLEQL